MGSYAFYYLLYFGSLFWRVSQCAILSWRCYLLPLDCNGVPRSLPGLALAALACFAVVPALAWPLGALAGADPNISARSCLQATQIAKATNFVS